MGVHDFSANSLDKDRLRPSRPSKTEALNAVITLLKWAGEDPSREGLIETPARVLKAYDEWFRGYRAKDKIPRL